MKKLIIVLFVIVFCSPAWAKTFNDSGGPATELKLPTTSSSSVGTIDQNNVPLVHTYTPTLTPTASYGHNIFFGKDAGNFSIVGNGVPFGVGNVCLGEASCTALTTGYFNMCIGGKSCNAMTDSADNVCIGSEACSLLSGSTNYITAVGDKAMYQASGQIRRGTAIGTQSGALLKNDGVNYATDSFTFVGDSSGVYVTDSRRDVLIGTATLARASSDAIFPNSADNVFIGYHAGFDGANWNPGVEKTVAIGSEVLKSLDDSTEGNIAIGFNAADNITTGEDNIIIGKSIDAPSATANAQMKIAEVISATSIYTTPKIGIGTAADGTNAVNLAGPAMIQSGGSANHSICWRADGKTLGYCSDAPNASGICTCA